MLDLEYKFDKLFKQVPNNLNEEFIEYSNNTVCGFNPYENPLDVEDIYVFPPNEQISDINDIGYEDVSYFDLDYSQSNILPLDDTEISYKGFEDIFQNPIIFINEVK